MGPCRWGMDTRPLARGSPRKSSVPHQGPSGPRRRGGPGARTPTSPAPPARPAPPRVHRTMARRHTKMGSDLNGADLRMDTRKTVSCSAKSQRRKRRDRVFTARSRANQPKFSARWPWGRLYPRVFTHLPLSQCHSGQILYFASNNWVAKRRARTASCQSSAQKARPCASCASGASGLFDVRPCLGGEVFGALRENAEFAAVHTGRYFIEWACGADLSADTIEAHLEPAPPEFAQQLARRRPNTACAALRQN